MGAEGSCFQKIRISCPVPAPPVIFKKGFGKMSPPPAEKENFPRLWQFLPPLRPRGTYSFIELGMAWRMQQGTTDEVARNGAPLRINFGQRVSWAPLAFS